MAWTAATALLWAAASHGQVIWHVDDDVCPEYGAGTEAQPFCGIQDAIAAAAHGDTIRVAPGVYLENLNYLGKAVEVESAGGAAVTTIRADRPDRVVRFNADEGPASILDGFTITGGSGGIACANSSPTIRNCIITGNTTDTGAGIECYAGSPTITHCAVENNRANLTAGGIICNARSSPLISDCTISTNEAGLSGGGIVCVDSSDPLIRRCTITHNATLGSGGGIASGDGSKPTIESCTIAGNGATAGAGIDCYNSSPTIRNSTIAVNIADEIAGGINCKRDSSPTITNCTFQYNRAGLNGGGIICNENSNATIIACVIANNRAVNGAGLYIFDNSKATLRRCDILNNIATGFGGGVVCAGSEPNFDECTFRGNEAESGAGIGCGESDAIITNSIIQENVATQIGGGILCNNSSPTFSNCLFTRNRAGYGGGAVYNYNIGKPTLINCTLSGNSASEGSAVYGGQDSHPLLANCIVWSNGASSFFLDGTSTMAATYSLTQPFRLGDGNITGIPAFLGPDDFRLSTVSPCIDAGDNGHVPSYPAGDLDGFPRFIDHPLIDDTGAGTPPLVDMGAYEYRDCNSNGVEDRVDVAHCGNEAWCTDANDNGVPDSCEASGDLSMDGRVDWADTARLIPCMSGPAGTFAPSACRAFDFATADVDVDGDVDLKDAAVVFNGFFSSWP